MADYAREKIIGVPGAMNVFDKAKEDKKPASGAASAPKKKTPYEEEYDTARYQYGSERHNVPLPGEMFIVARGLPALLAPAGG